MARGGYYVGERGADEFAEALKKAGGKMNELRDVHRQIAGRAQLEVRSKTPVYFGQHSRASVIRRSGAGHTVPGKLMSSIRGGASAQRSWVTAGPAEYLILQEFGGTSFWHTSGAGSLRAANRAHRSVEESASRAGVRGHVIYKKPRAARGYFIWNVAYRLRNEIARAYTSGIADAAEKYGIVMEIATSPQLDIKQSTWRRV